MLWWLGEQLPTRHRALGYHLDWHCQRDEGDTPLYRPQSSNDLNWCSGSHADMPYHCSLSVVIGVKE